jgi:hypothetical protein
MSEYSISTDYLNVLNSKVNNLQDYVTRQNQPSLQSRDNISTFKLCCITLILMLLGYAIYVYLDKNDFFDEVKPEPTSTTKESTPFPKIKPSNIKQLKQNIKQTNKQVRFKNDNTDNNLQNNKKSKGGKFCYLGSDRGFRSCAKLQDNQECESQKLFPTMEMCVNPQLRYT